MFIEQPPFLYRAIFKGTYWRFFPEKKSVYLTFDDGPIPEVTFWILDLLDRYNIKATFFCVADNVRKYPDIYREILNRGHQVGNHTYHHLQGMCTRTKNYVRDTDLAAELISGKLFRPPHGHIRFRQLLKLRRKYQIIMWDVVTRDYSKKRGPKQVFDNVKKYTRNGSVIVFHDSIRSIDNLKESLPQSIEWLIEQGYSFDPIPILVE